MTYAEREKQLGQVYHQQELFETVDDNLIMIEQKGGERARAKDIETYDECNVYIQEARKNVLNVFEEMEEEIRRLYNEKK